MPQKLSPVYFENQKQAASLLRLDPYELKEWKAEGCPAFKYGRIYHAELLEWIRSHKPRAERRRLKSQGIPCDLMDETTVCRKAAANAMIGLAQCANAGILTDEQYFKLGIMIAEASKDEEILKQWIQVLFDFLSENFAELSDAREAYPTACKWLCRQAGMSK